MHRTIVQQNLCIDERKERQRVFTEGVQAKKIVTEVISSATPRAVRSYLNRISGRSQPGCKDRLAMRNKQPAVTMQKTEG